eukprot:8205675-Alexandrium_andersonii.AAC.1
MTILRTGCRPNGRAARRRDYRPACLHRLPRRHRGASGRGNRAMARAWSPLPRRLRRAHPCPRGRVLDVPEVPGPGRVEPQRLPFRGGALDRL